MEPSAASSGGDLMSTLSGGAAIAQVSTLLAEQPMTPPHSPPLSVHTSPGAVSTASSGSSPGRVVGVVGIARGSHSDMEASAGSSTSGSPFKSPAHPPALPGDDTVMTAPPKYEEPPAYAVPVRSVPSPDARKSGSDEVRSARSHPAEQRPLLPAKPSALVNPGSGLLQQQQQQQHPSRKKPNHASPRALLTSYESDC